MSTPTHTATSIALHTILEPKPHPLRTTTPEAPYYIPGNFYLGYTRDTYTSAHQAISERLHHTKGDLTAGALTLAAADMTAEHFTNHPAPTYVIERPTGHVLTVDEAMHYWTTGQKPADDVLASRTPYDAYPLD